MNWWVAEQTRLLADKHKCVECGEHGTHTRRYRDVCPTDRGNEVREGEEWVCDECDPYEDEK